MGYLGYQSTPGEKNIIFDGLSNATKNEKAKLKVTLDKLDKDGHEALELFTTKPIETPYLYELKIGKWRLFYTEAEEKIIVVHTCYKQKNKIELCDRKTASARAKDIHTYGIAKCNIIFKSI